MSSRDPNTGPECQNTIGTSRQKCIQTTPPTHTHTHHTQKKKPFLKVYYRFGMAMVVSNHALGTCRVESVMLNVQSQALFREPQVLVHEPTFESPRIGLERNRCVAPPLFQFARLYLKLAEPFKQCLARSSHGSGANFVVVRAHSGFHCRSQNYKSNN